MKKKLRTYHILQGIGLLLLVVAFFSEVYFLNHYTDIKRFKKSLRSNENQADRTLEALKSIEFFENIKASELPSNLQSGISYFVYEDKELVYWSNNLINVPEVFENNFYNRDLLKLNNGYYAVRKKFYLNRNYIALIPIYYEYNTHNSYLKNAFQPNLKPLFQTNLSLDSEQGEFISNKEGKYLFSLVQTDKLGTNDAICIFIAVLYLWGVLFLASYFIVILKLFKTRKQFVVISGLVGGILLLRFIMLYFRVPFSVQCFVLWVIIGSIRSEFSS